MLRCIRAVKGCTRGHRSDPCSSLYLLTSRTGSGSDVGPRCAAHCSPQALTRKQQQDLVAAYQARATQPGAGGSASGSGGGGGLGGAGTGSGMGGGGGLPVPSAASNLGTFKLSMNNFTRELAASIPFAGKGRSPEAPGAVPGSPAVGKVRGAGTNVKGRATEKPAGRRCLAVAACLGFHTRRGLLPWSGVCQLPVASILGGKDISCHAGGSLIRAPA